VRPSGRFRSLFGRKAVPRRAVPLRRPSFLYKLNERRRKVEKDPGIVGPAGDKLATYRMAGQHGFAVAELITIADRVEDVEWDMLPPSFVVKPTDGYFSRGVFAVADGWSVFDGEPFSRARAASTIRSLAERGVVSGPVVVEELLADEDSVPDDWKVYAFHGQVELVLQKRMNGSRDPSDWRYKWWDGSLEAVGPIRWDMTHDPSLPAPRRPEALITMASEVSLALDTPFVRVDLFDCTDGVFLGELTPRPGGKHVFAEEWDVRLGAAWEDAELRLRAAG
jgi:hypothetical protein